MSDYKPEAMNLRFDLGRPVMPVDILDMHTFELTAFMHGMPVEWFAHEEGLMLRVKRLVELSDDDLLWECLAALSEHGIYTLADVSRAPALYATLGDRFGFQIRVGGVERYPGRGDSALYVIEVGLGDGLVLRSTGLPIPMPEPDTFDSWFEDDIPDWPTDTTEEAV